MNRKAKRGLLDVSCMLIAGDRGIGKSSFMALVADVYHKAGYPIYCQYPYKDANVIPMTAHVSGGVTKYDIDKDWLYSADLNGSCILIDECRTIWPARSYAKWSQADDEFFNFLRRYDMHVFLATQVYDAVDLNVRRASDRALMLSKSFWHFTYIEESVSTIAKVADKNTEVLGRHFKQGMRKVQYDTVECPTRHYRFWRKPYYNSFDTFYTYEEKKQFVPTEWNSVFDFDRKEIIMR